MRNISKPATANPGWVVKRARIAIGVFALTTTAVFSLGPATPPSPVSSHTVTIAGLKFSPGVLRIHRGDQVVFRNEDIMPHTATAKGPAGFDSGLIKPGESWSFSPEHEGLTEYACTFHPLMAGSIVVERP
jgi:plastocyanin